MTDGQQNDQAALNGLVDEFGWIPLCQDIIIYQEGNCTDWYFIVEVTEKYVMGTRIWPPGVEMLKDTYKPIPIDDAVYYPLAGTWVEGRLRELIGEAFVSIRAPDIINEVPWIVTVNNPDIKLGPMGANEMCRGKSPITALVTALRALKQKEVKSDS